MGKKRIITTQGDTVNTAEQSTASVTKKTTKRQVINGVAYIHVSYNNTLVTITDSKGEVISWSSAGKLGFKGTKKSTPYAANLVAKDCVEKAKKYNLTNYVMTNQSTVIHQRPAVDLGQKVKKGEL